MEPPQGGPARRIFALRDRDSERELTGAVCLSVTGGKHEGRLRWLAAR